MLALLALTLRRSSPITPARVARHFGGLSRGDKIKHLNLSRKCPARPMRNFNDFSET